MRLPNFFIIGAPKCGTTSLAEWLRFHPQIYVSQLKEPMFFAHDIKLYANQRIHTWPHYYRLFRKASPEHLAVGEASTGYLFSRAAVPTIEKSLPGSKYIAMIRNPVEMAFSLHRERYRAFLEDEGDFYRAWCLAPERRMGRYVPPHCPDPILLDYPSWCLLGEQLERLFALVPRERVLVLVLDDVKENPRREYLRVLEFLGVPDDGRKEFPALNPYREWRSQLLGKSLIHISRWSVWLRYTVGILPRRLGLASFLHRILSSQTERPPLPPNVRKELVTFFADDIQRLEHLLGREFSQWRD